MPLSRREAVTTLVAAIASLAAVVQAIYIIRNEDSALQANLHERRLGYCIEFMERSGSFDTALIRYTSQWERDAEELAKVAKELGRKPDEEEILEQFVASVRKDGGREIYHSSRAYENAEEQFALLEANLRMQLFLAGVTIHGEYEMSPPTFSNTADEGRQFLSRAYELASALSFHILDISPYEGMEFSPQSKTSSLLQQLEKVVIMCQDLFYRRVSSMEQSERTASYAA